MRNDYTTYLAHGHKYDAKKWIKGKWRYFYDYNLGGLEKKRKEKADIEAANAETNYKVKVNYDNKMREEWKKKNSSIYKDYDSSETGKKNQKARNSANTRAFEAMNAKEKADAEYDKTVLGKLDKAKAKAKAKLDKVFAKQIAKADAKKTAEQRKAREEGMGETAKNKTEKAIEIKNIRASNSRSAQRRKRENAIAETEMEKSKNRENIKNYRELRHSNKVKSDAIFEKALKRMGYDLDDIKKEPENMKDTVEHINRDYEKDNRETSMNCSYCTSAFDLRRRGYDLEAAHIKTDGKSTYEIMNWYDGAELKRPGTLISDKDYLKYWSSGGTKIDVEAKQKQAEKVADDMNKQILADMGTDPESNGHVIMSWLNGGGHDITYFVSGDKKVHYYDNQVNKEIDINYYLLNAYSVDYFRTDNLAINERVLETVAIDRGRMKKR